MKPNFDVKDFLMTSKGLKNYWVVSGLPGAEVHVRLQQNASLIHHRCFYFLQITASELFNHIRHKTNFI